MSNTLDLYDKENIRSASNRWSTSIIKSSTNDKNVRNSKAKGLFMPKIKTISKAHTSIDENSLPNSTTVTPIKSKTDARMNSIPHTTEKITNFYSISDTANEENIGNFTRTNIAKRITNPVVESPAKRRLLSSGKSSHYNVITEYDLNFNNSVHKSILNAESHEIAPMTIRNMLEFIIFNHNDEKTTTGFILSYTHFKLTPINKLSMLKNMFHHLPVKYWKINSTVSGQRALIAKYFAEWVKLSSTSDFELESNDKNSIKVPSKEYSSFYEDLKTLDFEKYNISIPSPHDLEMIFSYKGQSHSRKNSVTQRPCLVDVPKSFYGMDSSNFAQQISIYEFKLFKNIQQHELIGQAWNKECKEEKAPRITNMINHFNRMTNWIVFEVTQSSDSPKDQAKKIEKFISIGRKLKRLGNMNGVMEIVTGLMSNSIQKLPAWKVLSDKVTAKLKKLESVVTPSQNFKEYRRRIETTKGLVIPYPGIHLSDIVRLMDGFEDASVGVYEFDKVMQLGNILALWRKLQRQDSVQEVEPSFAQFIHSIRTISVTNSVS